MKAQHANPFIQAAVMTFRKEVNVDLQRSDLVARTAPSPTKDVSVIIGVTGIVKGQVVYSMDRNVAEAVAKTMLPDLHPMEQKKMVNSAVSELANIITGQASIILAGEHDIIDLTPPAVFTGVPGSVDFISIQTISVSFLSVVGALEINIGLMEERGA